jgi:tetratricopeptide (TPR) repeat protein
MDERKARLLRELEEVTQKEEEMKEEEKWKDLERRAETVCQRIIEHEAETASKKAHVASQGLEKELQSSPTTENASTASSHSRPRFNNSIPPISQTTAGHSPGYNGHSPPSDSVAPAGSFEILASSHQNCVAGTISSDCIRKFETLKYYKDLDGDVDAGSCSLNEMDLDQLYCLVTYNKGTERDIKQAKLTGHIYYFIFLKTKVLEDLERAIDRAQEQIPANTNSPQFAQRLKDLIVMQVKKCQYTKSSDDLQEAIFRAQDMMAATPLDHSDRSARVGDLIGMMLMKFNHTKSQEDLDKVIISAREIAWNDAALTSSLANRERRLAQTYENYQQTGSLENLNEVTRTIEQIGDMAGEYVTPDELSLLGVRLSKRFERTGSIKNLDRAINMMDNAVALTQDHFDQAMYLSNLGSSLVTQFEQSSSIEDLNRAIDYTGKAVAATPQDHPNRATYLYSLGKILATRSRQIDSKDDLNNALFAYKEGWRCLYAPPSIRIRLARSAADILISRFSWEESSFLLQEAVNLLPIISPRSLKHTDKQHMLAEFAGLASLAAATALNARKDPIMPYAFSNSVGTLLQAC